MRQECSSWTSLPRNSLAIVLSGYSGSEAVRYKDLAKRSSHFRLILCWSKACWEGSFWRICCFCQSRNFWQTSDHCSTAALAKFGRSAVIKLSETVVAANG